MTDIVERMKATACPDNTGCMSIRMCVCDVMGGAVDEIERLRGVVINLSVIHMKLTDDNEQLHEDVRRLRVEAGYD